MNKLLAVFFFLITHTGLMGQQQPLAWQVNRAVYFGHYQSAQQLLDATISRSNCAPDSKEMAIHTSLSGYLHYIFARYTQADSCLTSAAFLFEKNACTADSNYLKTLTWQAGVCRDLNDFKRAKATIEKGLLAAEQCKKTPHYAFKAGLLQQLAWYDGELCRLSDGDLHYRQLLDFREAENGKKSPEMAYSLVQYAGFLKNNRSDYAQSEKMLLQARKILEPVAQRYPLEYVETISALADLYSFGLPKYAQGIALQEETVAFAGQYLGEKHNQYALQLRSLGVYYSNYTDKFLLVDSIYRRALSIFTENMGERFPARVGTMQDIAGWKGALGRYKEATEIRKDAFALCERIFGPQHTSTAMLQLAVAGDLLNEGKRLEADSLLDRVLAIYKEKYGTFHPSYFAALKKKGELWQWQGRYDRADSLSLDIQSHIEQLYGKNSPQRIATNHSFFSMTPTNMNRPTVDSILNYTENYYVKNGLENQMDYWNLLSQRMYWLKNGKKIKEALAISDKLEALVEKNLGKTNYWYLSELRSKTALWMEARDFARAEANIETYKQISDQVYGPVSGGRRDYYTDLINLYQETKTDLDVLTVQEAQVELEEKLGGSGLLYCLNLNALANSYFNYGRYGDAKKLINKLKDFAQQSMGTQDMIYLQILFSAAQMQVDLDDYAAARAIMAEYKAICIDLGMFSDGNLGGYLMSMGKLEEKAGNYQEAAAYYAALKPIKWDIDYAYYNLYGSLLTDLSRYREADSLLTTGLKILESRGEYAGFFYNNLANNQNMLGNMAQALAYSRRALEQGEAHFGSGSPELATLYSNHASNLRTADQFSAAEVFAKKALAILEKTKGPNHSDYALKLKEYGIFLQHTGHYQEAIDTLESVLRIFKLNRKTNHPDYYNVLAFLQLYYQEIGDMQKAEEICRDILQYWKIQAPQSESYAGALSAYGQFYRNIGQYDAALRVFAEMEVIYRSIFGKESPRMVDVRAQIATTQKYAKAFDAAIDNYLICLKYDSIALGVNHSNYAIDLHNIGTCYLNKGNYSAAARYLQKSIAIKEAVFQQPVKVLGQSYQVLAQVYEAQNRMEDARVASQKALDILAVSGGEYSDDYLAAQLELGRIFTQQNRLAEAQLVLEKGYAAYRSKIRGAFSYFSTVQQQSLLAKYNLTEFAPFNSPANPPPFWGGMVYDNALMTKGIALQNDITIREILAADTASSAAYHAWLEALSNLQAQYSLPIAERANIDSLQALADGQEKILIRQSEPYKKYLVGFDIRWQDVQHHLKPNEVAIEFVRYKQMATDGQEAYWYAGAVLLPDGQAPHFVPLCAERDLPAELHDNKRRDPETVAAMYNIPIGTTRGDARKVANSLYGQLWRPLESLIPDGANIYFAPVGLLHRINLGLIGFLDSEGRETRLMQQYVLTQLGSTREIAATAVPVAAAAGPALYVGDIDYGTLQRSENGHTRASFNPLAQAAQKMEHTTAIFEKNGVPVRRLSGKDATEMAVEQALEAPVSPRALIIDSHGFFLPEPVEPGSDTVLVHLYAERNPMMQSGLAFAQVNAGLQLGRKARPESDGVLTAQDFSKANLRQTEVVILPVCNSGLGKIESTEGVFGLQRAFKQAGARYVLMSLWEVPDDYIQLFTDAFLQQWLEGKRPVPEAFRATQRALMMRGVNLKTWGAMILIQ